jgi:hypothetical protein
MELLLLMVSAVAVSCVALILRQLRKENRVLQAEAAERKTREEVYIDRMAGRLKVVQREHNRMVVIDPKIRADFE